MSQPVVQSVAAVSGDDIREGFGIPTRDGFDVVVDTPDVSFLDDDSFAMSLPDFGAGSAVQEDAQSLADQTREGVGIGSVD